MWTDVKLGEVCDFQNGFAFKSRLFKESGKPILRISNIQNQEIDDRKIVYFDPNDYDIDLSRYLVKPNDLLIAMSGATTGKIGFNKSNNIFYLNQRVGNLKPKSILNKSYLYYLLSTKVEENLRISKGAAQPNLSSEQIKNISFRLPPLSEQQRIVAKLDAAFAEIDQVNSSNKQALRQKQKLEENFHKDFFKSLEDEYGLINLEEGIELISGQHIMSKDYNSNRDGIGYLTGPADFGSVSPVVSKFTLKPKKTAIKNDILITLKGSGIGKVNIMDQNELAISRQLAAIRSIKFDPSYLFIFLKTKFDYFQKLGNGAAIPGLSRKDVQKLEVPKAPIAKQHEVLEKLQKFQMLIRGYETLQNLKYKELNSLKSSILSKELQGEVI